MFSVAARHWRPVGARAARLASPHGASRAATAARWLRTVPAATCQQMSHVEPVGTRLSPQPVPSVTRRDEAQGVAGDSGGAVDFTDSATAYASLTTSELARAGLVLRICSSRLAVQHSKRLIAMGAAVLGHTIMNRLLKATFFGHFCAGEDADEIKPRVELLQKYGVGGILDYAAEADVAPNDAADAHDESECDANARISLMAIEAAAQQRRGFAAIKLTALGKPELLHHISSILVDIRNLFSAVVGESHPEAGVHASVDAEQFAQGLTALGLDEPLQDFTRMDVNLDGQVDFMEWLDDLDPRTLGKQRLKTFMRTPMLSDVELTQLDNMFARLHTLVDAANEHGVRLMVDAEQTYMQPAIDHIVMQLQRKHNRGDTPVVFNTYQAYLKDSYSRLSLDVKRAQNDGFTFACKLVRGAYMVQERQIADDNQVESPVHNCIQDTHDCYNSCLRFLMDNRHNAEFLIASHNEDSVRLALQLMEEHGVPKSGGGVYFGQLLGMCDFVSYPLGAAGYDVYKYVPYGPVHEVLPYLIRRAQENVGLLGNAGKEHAMIQQELSRRMN